MGRTKNSKFYFKSHTWRYFTKRNRGLGAECSGSKADLRYLWLPDFVEMTVKYMRPNQTPELAKLNNIHIFISATIHFNAHLLPFFQLADPLQASHHQVHCKTVIDLRSWPLQNKTTNLTGHMLKNCLKENCFPASTKPVLAKHSGNKRYAFSVKQQTTH